MIYASKLLKSCDKHNNQISAQYLPLKAVSFQFYDIIQRHCESIVVLKRKEKKRLHKFFKRQWLNFQNFQPGELLSNCSGCDLNLSLSP